MEESRHESTEGHRKSVGVSNEHDLAFYNTAWKWRRNESTDAPCRHLFPVSPTTRKAIHILRPAAENPR